MPPFGYSTFRYWGFEGKVDNLNVPIMGGIKITGFTGGAFYRMIPDKEKTILPGYENMAIVLKPDEKCRACTESWRLWSSSEQQCSFFHGWI